VVDDRDIGSTSRIEVRAQANQVDSKGCTSVDDQFLLHFWIIRLKVPKGATTSLWAIKGSELYNDFTTMKKDAFKDECVTVHVTKY
jgi:hypothetical protein